MAFSARTCLRVPATSSGNMCDWSSRVREKMVTSFPSLWICARRPSYLYCATTAPIFARMASAVGSRSASCEWIGLPTWTSRVATARCASSSPDCSKTRPGDEPQIRGLIVGPLQQLALFGIVPPGLRQGVKDRRVPDAQPQVAQQDAHHIFGRYAVGAREQAGKSGNLLFDRSFAGRLRDGSQLLKHVLDTQHMGVNPCFVIDLPCDQSQIPERRIQRCNMLWGGVRSHGNGPGHGFLRHPHLQRYEERRYPPLDQVADMFDFIWTFYRAKQLC